MVWEQDIGTLLQTSQTVFSATSAGILGTLWYRLARIEEGLKDVSRELKEHILEGLKDLKNRKCDMYEKEREKENILIG